MKIRLTWRLAVITVCTSLLCTSAMAANIQTNVSPIQNNTSQSYISEEELIKYAKEFIIQQAESDADCPWSTNTTISQSVKLYDLSGSKNGYIFNLKSGKKETGYLVVYGFKEKITVDEFSYSGKCFLQSDKFDKLKDKKIIGLGTERYGYIDDSNNIRDVYTDKIANGSKKELYGKYKDFRAFAGKTSNSSIYPNDVIYDPHKSIYIQNSSNYNPCTQDTFNVTDACVPVSVVNMLKYWSDCRGANTFVDGNIYTTWDHIINFLDFPNSAQNNVSAYNGVIAYSNENNGTDLYAGSDFVDTTDFSWIYTNVLNSNLIVLGINVNLIDSDRNGGHNVTVVGCRGTDNNGNRYVIVDNGWGNDQGWTWIRWPGDGNSDIGNAFYLRW